MARETLVAGQRLVGILGLLLAAAGCGMHIGDRNGDDVVRIVCLGDSNTQSGDPRVGETWCDQLADRFRRWEIVNLGKGFARAGGDRKLWGLPLLRNALLHAPDVLLIALGTNDLIGAEGTTDTTLAALLAMRHEAVARGVDVIIATIPPAMNHGAGVNRRIAWTNALLRFFLPEDQLIDFDTGMRAEDFFPDGIHANSLGQNKRAAAAGRTLSRLMPN